VTDVDDLLAWLCGILGLRGAVDFAVYDKTQDHLNVKRHIVVVWLRLQ